MRGLARVIGRGKVPLLAFIGAAVLSPLSGATAQEDMGAELVGLITAQDRGAPVEGAEILLEGREVAVTGAAGSFVVTDIVPGEYRFAVRAVGYQPYEVIINLPHAKTYQIEVPLQPSAVELDAITVEALRLPRNRLGEIFERMTLSSGDFITRADLEKWHALETSHALSRSRKIRLNYVNVGECLDEALFGPLGGTAFGAPNVPSGNTPTIPAGGTCLDMQARPTIQVLMGRGFMRCVPSLYLDGVRFPLRRGDQIDDVVGPRDIELIEIYSEFEVPGEFTNSDIGCGVIAIWTRAG